MPPSGTRSSRSFITCKSLCFIFQAVFRLTPSCRASSSDETLVLALRQQVERQQPDGQRQLGGGEDRAGDEGGPAVAGMALPELAGADAAVPAEAALRAAEAVRPAGLEDGLLAWPLAAVALQELAQTESLLELHAIAFHLLSPFLSEVSDLLQYSISSAEVRW